MTSKTETWITVAKQGGIRDEIDRNFKEAL
jgi:hypothetical protein